MDEKISRLCAKAKLRGFIPHVAEKEQVNALVESLIGAEPKTIGSGGSMTLHDLGTLFGLAAKGHKVYSYDTVSDEERPTMYQRAAKADWFVSSANAITTSGDIVNIDGTANRVAPLLFGVPNIIYVFGVNKIVDTLDEAIDRVRNHACPLNARRLNKNTPCAITGKCSMCNSADCICNVTTIVHHPTRLQAQVHLIIVPEQLGY